MKILLTSTLVTVLLLAGCAWVRLDPEAQHVRMATKSEVTTCKQVGRTTVSMLSKVVGIQRNPKKVALELSTLARNEAADLGGDTIVPVSAVKGGEQSFAVYQCLPPQ